MADLWDQFRDATPTASGADPWSQFSDAPAPQDAAPGSTLTQDQRNPLPLAKSRIEMGARQGANTAGVAQGALDVYRSVFDQPAAWLEKNVGRLPGPSAQATNAQDAGVAANLDKQMGTGAMPALMRLTGNALASAPLMLNPNLGTGYVATGLKGMLQGTEAAGLTNAGSDASLGSQVATGAALGGTIPLAGRGLFDAASWLKSKALPTGGVDQGLLALADKAQKLGINIRPGQQSPSPFIKVADDQLSRLPFTGNAPDKPLMVSPGTQREQFSRAVSKTFGADAPALTQDVMAQAQSRITGTMDEVLSRNAVWSTPEIHQKLADIKAAALDALDVDAAPVVNTLDKITTQLADKPITGDQYLNWRKRGGRLSALTESQNSTISHYGQQIRNALDDAFQSAAQGNDGKLLAQARAQYRNLKTVEPLAAKAPTGHISPALLLGAVRGEYPNFATKGAGDLGDLAKIGQAFLKEPPNSTTAERSFLLGLMNNPLKAGGEALGMPLSASIGRGMNKAINSQSYLNSLKGVPVGGVPLKGANGVRMPIANLLSIPLLNRLLASSSEPSR